MDVGEWLRTLDLGQYEATFRANAVDATLLPRLTGDDLKDLGVLPVGHRRKLLDAIAALRDVPTDAAERRQVTVMFADLVGSTALSSSLDPEDLREILSTYQRSVAGTVHGFGGFVAKFMGDGVLAYFGYPLTQEDDAERAVRAGLAVVEAVRLLPTAVALHSRVGIATGLVVVGDLVGAGPAQERGIAGETPNLAARLQGIAEPDGVVISATTRSLVGSLFELEHLGARDLKGLARPTHAWAALRPSRVASRFDALRAASAPLVGRDRELGVLLGCWEQAKTGAGQVVLLSADPGIGKSRLAGAFGEGIAGDAHVRIDYACSPQHAGSTLYPVCGQLERAAGLTRGDSPAERCDKLDAWFAATATPGEDAALVAELLGVADARRARELTAEQWRERTLQALVDQLGRQTQAGPLLIVVEDAHWCDPSTRELLDRLIARVPTLRALMIVTFRPEFETAWDRAQHVTRLTLERLTDADAAAIAAHLLATRGSPQHLLSSIVARADGVPLFVEEITRAVIEAEDEAPGRRDAGSHPPVPATLHASLTARLDRLGPAKEIAQIGAAIGREFAYDLLAAVTPRRAADLDAALDRLVAAGLMFRQGRSPQQSYIFKHALIRDAAYGTLVRPSRRALHRRIADALERQAAAPEILAHHFGEAGEIERSAAFWGIAGQKSRARSALAEAEVQLTRALDQLATLPETTAVRRSRIALQVELVTVLMHTRGYGAPETKAAADRARALIELAEAAGEPQEDPLLLFSVIYGFWVVNIAAFDGTAALDLATQFRDLAERQMDTGPLLLSHRMLGMTLMSVGRPAEGRDHLDRALSLYAPAAHRALAERFGTDARIAILEWRSRALWLLGFSDAAKQDAEQSLQGAREIDEAATLMHALAHTTATLILRGDIAEANAATDELIVLAADKGSEYWAANGRMWRGCLLTLAGRFAEAVDVLASALEHYVATGATIYTPFVVAHYARALAALGRLDDARNAVESAIARVELTGERWCEPEVLRIKGELMLLAFGQHTEDAEAALLHSLAVARRQQARSWELRTATSLARLWRDRGRRPEARILLAPVYGRFTEGFETPDLVGAGTLLDAL